MDTFFIPTEFDFKKWIKDAVLEVIAETKSSVQIVTEGSEEKLMSRKEIANLLGVSLVTLTDWVKRGLPNHKQRGRVYFLRSEVLDYLRRNSRHKFKLHTGISE